MKNRCLTYRELRKILSRYGIQEDKSRGKGAHRMLVGVVDGIMRKYPVSVHKESIVLASSIVAAIRRAFGLIPERGHSDHEFYR